jgi:hypothetical protein
VCNKKKKEGVSSRTISSPTADPPQVLVFIKREFFIKADLTFTS